jgi:hypothetical protein
MTNISVSQSINALSAYEHWLYLLKTKNLVSGINCYATDLIILSHSDKKLYLIHNAIIKFVTDEKELLFIWIS